MKITLCTSAKFFDKLPEIKNTLEELGHEIFLPSMRDYHFHGEDSLAKIQFNLIQDHFDKIDKSDAIYVLNEDKNDITGYIGGNTFLEMGKAFDRGIPIYLFKDVPKGLNYREELVALKPIVIGTDWDKL